jgi:serine/threonine-protein kinase
MAQNLATAVAKPAPKSGDPLIGADVIGQYVIRSQLGKGGMGAVYLADQPSVGRQAVIKVLHPRLSRDADTQKRFETEARAASQLSHSNIVTIYNYGAMADGTLFLAMEYLDGQTLAQATAKRPLPVPRAIEIVSQIASALGEAHRRGVIHRDVKPTNVMLVERDGHTDFVKVLDFGIARVDGQRMTETGDISGTPVYMSPEQIGGKPLDGRSDLYSLGCLMFELVTGDVPFDGGNTLGIAYKHVHEEPPAPSSLAPKAGISPALDAFIARALAKDPADRPRDAAAFRDELRAALEPPKAAAPAPAPKVTPPVAAPKVAARETAPKIAPPPAVPAPKPAKKPPREGLFARIRRRFRRRRSLGERLVTRVKMLTGRRRAKRRWPWFVAAIAAVSLIGWYLATHSSKDTHELVKPPTKPAKHR